MSTEIIRAIRSNGRSDERAMVVTYDEALLAARRAEKLPNEVRVEIFVEATNEWEDIVAWLEIQDEMYDMDSVMEELSNL